MNIINFFHNAPVLATLITLVYATIWGVFVYILIPVSSLRSVGGWASFKANLDPALVKHFGQVASSESEGQVA